MSYFRRLAVATRGFRGGSERTAYVSQELEIKDEDLVKGLIIEETADIATIQSFSVSVDVVNSALSVLVDQSTGISIDIESSSQTVSVSTC